jgi:hypothetical protein
MARRTSRSSTPEPTSMPHLTVPRDELDRQLEERINRGRELQERPIATETDLKAARADYYTWHDYNVTLLQRSFSTPALPGSTVVRCLGQPLQQPWSALAAESSSSLQTSGGFCGDAMAAGAHRAPVANGYLENPMGPGRTSRPRGLLARHPQGYP